MTQERIFNMHTSNSDPRRIVSRSFSGFFGGALIGLIGLMIAVMALFVWGINSGQTVSLWVLEVVQESGDGTFVSLDARRIIAVVAGLGLCGALLHAALPGKRVGGTDARTAG
jgi:hypothetical protein